MIPAASSLPARAAAAPQRITHASLTYADRKKQIVIIDDDPAVPPLLRNMLPLQDSELYFFPDSSIALTALQQLTPDLILLSHDAPYLAGFDFCSTLKQSHTMQDVPVIFLSRLDDADTKITAFKCGAVDYIVKPFHFSELKARISVHLSRCALAGKLEFQKLVETKVREVAEAQQATIFALAKLAEQRDQDTGSHLERVCEYCRLLAVQLAIDSPYADQITPEFIECIQHAAPLHDVGKVAIPDRILLKPGPLTPEEFEIMKSHSVIGAENMQLVYNKYSGNPFIGMGIEIALYHHERWDGSGYPDGLAGRNIPLPARIMTLADVYDALRSDRCYRKGLDHDRVRTMILEENGRLFDPALVAAFLQLEEQFRQVHYQFL